MKIKVTLSANAGVAIEAGEHQIWVDALHEEKRSGFSRVDPEIFKNEAFLQPEHICFTHCHGDHFSENLTKTAMQRWPSAKLYLPEPVFPEQNLVSGENLFFHQGDLKLRFFPLPHEGAQYAHVKHCGIMISLGGCNILHAGDCATGSPALMEALNGERVDLAILDFPWITLAKGRGMLKKLQPGHILACHLPFAGDDENGYRESAIRSRDGLPMDVRLLMEPFQQEQINIEGRA